MPTAPKRKKLTPEELSQIKNILVKAQQFQLAARVREQEPRKKKSKKTTVDNIIAIVQLVTALDGGALERLKEMIDKTPPKGQWVSTENIDSQK